MKAFVYDQDWAGASIYIGTSREAAISHFRDGQMEYCLKMNELHERDHPTRPNPHMKRYIDLRDNFDSYVKEYDIFDGLTIETEGG